jgi:hypothetical protein
MSFDIEEAVVAAEAFVVDPPRVEARAAGRWSERHAKEK